MISIIYDLRKKCNNEVVTPPLLKYLVLHVLLFLVFIFNKLLRILTEAGSSNLTEQVFGRWGVRISQAETLLILGFPVTKSMAA